MREITSLLLAFHIVSMSVASTIPLATVWFEYCEGRGDRIAGVVGRWLLGAALGLFLAGALLGLLIGWIQWDGGLADALTRLAGKVRYGVLELLFSSILMLVHWIWWRAAPDTSVAYRGLRLMLGILAGTNLLYHFPVLFAVTSHLIHHGESVGEVISPSEFRQYIVDPSIGARIIHIVLASFAACGVAVVAGVNFFPIFRHVIPSSPANRQASSDLRSDEDKDQDEDPHPSPSIESAPLQLEMEVERRRFTAWGARIAILPTIAQIPTGLWVFAQLSPLAQGRVLGQDLLAGPLLLLGIGSALWLLHLLASLCLGEDNRRLCRRTTWVFLLTMVLMTLSSRRVMAGFPTPRSEASQSSADASLVIVPDVAQDGSAF